MGKVSAGSRRRRVVAALAAAVDEAIEHQTKLKQQVLDLERDAKRHALEVERELGGRARMKKGAVREVGVAPLRDTRQTAVLGGQ